MKKIPMLSLLLTHLLLVVPIIVYPQDEIKYLIHEIKWHMLRDHNVRLDLADSLLNGNGGGIKYYSELDYNILINMRDALLYGDGHKLHKTSNLMLKQYKLNTKCSVARGEDIHYDLIMLLYNYLLVNGWERPNYDKRIRDVQFVYETTISRINREMDEKIWEADLAYSRYYFGYVNGEKTPLNPNRSPYMGDESRCGLRWGSVVNRQIYIPVDYDPESKDYLDAECGF